MAGGVFSEAQLFGMTIRESATDGSDFTNPAADYRRLFLGEDGLLHLKDSAGTVTDVGGGSGIPATIFDAAGDMIVASAADTAARMPALVAGKVNLTSGDLTTTSGTFVDATGLTVTLTTGAHRCRVTLSGAVIHSAASIIAVDFAVDGTRQGQTYGLWLGALQASTNTPLGISFLTDVLTAASHTIKVQWLTGAATATMYASAGVTPAVFSVEETLLSS